MIEEQVTTLKLPVGDEAFGTDARIEAEAKESFARSFYGSAGDFLSESVLHVALRLLLQFFGRALKIFGAACDGL